MVARKKSFLVSAWLLFTKKNSEGDVEDGA